MAEGPRRREIIHSSEPLLPLTFWILVISSSVLSQYFTLVQPFRGRLWLKQPHQICLTCDHKPRKTIALPCHPLHFPCYPSLLEDCFTADLCKSAASTIKRPFSFSCHQMHHPLCRCPVLCCVCCFPGRPRPCRHWLPPLCYSRPLLLNYSFLRMRQ